MHGTAGLPCSTVSGPASCSTSEVLPTLHPSTLLPPHPAAQPPADNEAQPVLTLTAKTFNGTVYKGDRDFFIEFYAPWW